MYNDVFRLLERYSIYYKVPSINNSILIVLQKGTPRRPFENNISRFPLGFPAFIHFTSPRSLEHYYGVLFHI